MGEAEGVGFAVIVPVVLDLRRVDDGEVGDSAVIKASSKAAAVGMERAPVLVMPLGVNPEGGGPV